MKLPPLRALQCFEVVARLHSFSKAALELNVTQSAVSHQVKILEGYLGENLFDRHGRAFTLSKVGARYFDEISSALMGLSKASAAIRYGKSDELRLALYSSLAMRWLIPRLDDFREQYPEINLTLNMVTDEPECNDNVADCFITIRPPKHHFVSQFLYAEKLYPVCGPKIWQQIYDKPLPDALWKHPLLSVQYNETYKSEPKDWQQWCARGGFNLPKEVKVCHFSHVLLATEAARYDLGITLIDNYLMTEQAHQYNLVRIPMHALITGDKFYFVYKKTRHQHPDIVKLGNWFKLLCLPKD